LSVNLDATKRIIGVLRRFYSFIRQRPVDIEEFEEKVGKTLRDYHDGIGTLKDNPKTLFQTAFFRTIAWSFDIIGLFLVFASIGYIISPDKIIITNIISGNLQSQGLALVGFAQVVSSSVYTVLGISPFLSVASTLLAGFASFWFKIIIAFFAFQFVVFSRCLPPFCMHLGGLRGKSRKDGKLVAQSNS